MIRINFRTIKKLKLIVIAFFLVFAFQNCTVSKFSKLNSDSILGGLQSHDGQIFDGKLRILHHIVDNFKCEGRLAPESILIRDSNTSWTWIQNTPDKCAFIEKTIYEGVDYDEASKSAHYIGFLYVPPKPYIVSASEDPNLPDINLLDGVCADVNGQCSVRAAAEQATTTALTEPVQVNIPAGTYAITKMINVWNVSKDSYPVKIKGADKSTTILDGGGNSPHFFIRSSGPSTVSIENLTLLNGLDNKASYASSIMIAAGAEPYDSNAKSPDGMVSINDCVFKNNRNQDVISMFPDSGSLQVHRTQFIDSDFAVIKANVFNSLLVEDSSIIRSIWGISAANNSGTVIIRSSAFDENYSALNLYNCALCAIENVTVANSAASGMMLQTTTADTRYDLSVKHVTFFNNGTRALLPGWPQANLNINYFSASNTVTLINSILAQPSTNINPNCNGVDTKFRSMVSNNSIFSDSSCVTTGSGNIIGDPQLGALVDNGGYSPTFIPLSGSPAINSGSNALCSSYDQRGLPRYPSAKKSQCDMGSVEIQ